MCITVTRLPTASVVDALAGVTTTPPEIHAKFLHRVRYGVPVVDYIHGVQLPVLALHQQAEVVCRGLLYFDGVDLVDDAKHVKVAVVAKVETELEPHPKVRQNAVAPVAGVEKDLCGSVTLLIAAFCGRACTSCHDGESS